MSAMMRAIKDAVVLAIFGSLSCDDATAPQPHLALPLTDRIGNPSVAATASR